MSRKAKLQAAGIMAGAATLATAGLLWDRKRTERRRQRIKRFLRTPQGQAILSQVGRHKIAEELRRKGHKVELR